MPRMIRGDAKLARALGVTTRKSSKRHKYNAKPTIFEGIRFDSKKEAQDYARARKLQDAGEIRTILLQVPFVVSPGIYDDETGECLAKPEIWRADRVIYWTDGRLTVHDTKGHKTREYLRKKRRVEARYRIEILET